MLCSRIYILIFILLSLITSAVHADDAELNRALGHFHQKYFVPGKCHQNIDVLTRMLAHYKLIDSSKAKIVIAEANDNELALGNAPNRYVYHVFLMHGGRVMDPLMFDMFGKGVAEVYEYFEVMFPKLKGVRFTAVDAQVYVDLDQADLEGLFRDYDIREQVPFGERKINAFGIAGGAFMQIWRQPLLALLRATGVRK